SFIETNPMIRASELPPKFLGISIVPPPAPVMPVPAATAPAEAGGEPAASAAAPAETAKPEPNLTIDERAKVSRLQGDLMWLVREGYVTEFIDGRLFAPPPMVEARKREVESSEHDPENFPEAPATPVSEAASDAKPQSAMPSEPSTEAAPPSEAPNPEASA